MAVMVLAVLAVLQQAVLAAQAQQVVSQQAVLAAQVQPAARLTAAT
jgi:hypothetical protein